MEEKLNEKSIHEITNSIYIQIKQYNNNYRPIYHLEIMLVNIINHIHNYNEPSDRKQLSNVKSKPRKCK